MSDARHALLCRVFRPAPLQQAKALMLDTFSTTEYMHKSRGGPLVRGRRPRRPVSDQRRLFSFAQSGSRRTRADQGVRPISANISALNLSESEPWRGLHAAASR